MALFLKDTGGGLDFDWGAVDASAPLRSTLDEVAKAAERKNVMEQAVKEKNRAFAYNMARAEIDDVYKAKVFNEQVAARKVNDIYKTKALTEQITGNRNQEIANTIAQKDRTATTKYANETRRIVADNATNKPKTAAKLKLEGEQAKEAKAKSIGLEAGQFAGYTPLAKLQEAFAYASENAIEGDTPEALASQRTKEVMASAIDQRKIMEVNSLVQTPVNKIEEQVTRATAEASKSNPDTAKIQTITNNLLKGIPKERKIKLTDDPQVSKTNMLKYGHDIGVDIDSTVLRMRRGVLMRINRFTEIKDPIKLAKYIYSSKEEKMRKKAKKAGRKELSFTEKTKLASVKKELDWLTTKDLTDPKVVAALRKITD